MSIQNSGLADDLLLKADKMTMAHSIELRVPFLDHSFVEFAASLPTDMKLRKTREDYSEKYILRKAVEGLIPEAVLNRPKVGFFVPVWSLFDTDLRTMASDLFSSRSFRESGLFHERRLVSTYDRKSKRSRRTMVPTLAVAGLCPLATTLPTDIVMCESQ